MVGRSYSSLGVLNSSGAVFMAMTYKPGKQQTSTFFVFKA